MARVSGVPVKAGRSSRRYLERRKQIENRRLLSAPRAAFTAREILLIGKKWKEYWEGKIDNEDFSRKFESISKESTETQASEFITFLEWLIDRSREIRPHSGVQKLSTIKQYWKNFQMLWRDSTATRIHADVLDQVKLHLELSLGNLKDSDDSGKPKPVMGVEDLQILLEHHWACDDSRFYDGRQRIQTALVALLCAGTAQRPCSILATSPGTCGTEKGEPDKNKRLGRGFKHTTISSQLWAQHSLRPASKKLKDGILYKDVEVQIKRLPGGDSMQILIVYINFRHTKGEDKRPRQKVFWFRQVESLTLDPVILTLALALHDQAFEVGFKSVEELFSLQLPAEEESWTLAWNREMCDTPFLREPRTGGGTLQSCPLSASTFSRYLARLGSSAGFERNIHPYMIRRGAANAVDTFGTAGERNQILDHVDPRTFQFYVDPTIKLDVQGAYQRNPCSEMASTVSRRRLRRDARAPSALDAAGKHIVDHDPILLELRTARSEARDQCRLVYGTAVRANGTKLGKEYSSLKAQCQARYYSLTERNFKCQRETWFKNRDSIAIAAQLQQEATTAERDADISRESTDQADERLRITHLMRHFGKSQEAQSGVRTRIELVQLLVAFCGRREPPKRRPARAYSSLQPSVGKTLDDDSANHEVPCERLQCMFCYHDSALLVTARVRTFSRTSTMWDHVDAHLLDASWPMSCPYRGCGEKCTSKMNFKYHAYSSHGVVLRPTGRAI